MIWLSSLLVAIAVSGMALSLEPAWQTLSRKIVADLDEQRKRLNMSEATLKNIMRIWGLSLIGVFVLFVFVLFHIPMLVAAGFVVYRAPRLIMELLIHRRRSLIRDQMVNATTAMINACRSGMALNQAMADVAGSAPEPIRTEFAQIVSDYEHGRPLPESIKAVRDRLDVEGFTLFSTAILVAIDRGGRLTEALERIGVSLRENQRLERKLEADTASGRMTLNIISFAPIGFLGMFLLMDYEGAKMFLFEPLGQVVVGVVFIMNYIALRMGQKILDINF